MTQRKLKDIPLEEFIRAWVKSSSLAQVITVLNCSNSNVSISMKSCYLRKKGIPLKRMGAGSKPPPDFDKLKKFHADLVAENKDPHDPHQEIVQAYLLKRRPTRLFRIEEMIEGAYTVDVPVDPHKDYKRYAVLLTQLGCTRENGGRPCTRYGDKGRWWKTPYAHRVPFRFPMTDKF